MGVSVSTATAVVGIALLIILQGLTTSILFSVEEFRQNLDEMKNRAVEQLQTDISIGNISDTGWWDTDWQNRKMIIINIYFYFMFDSLQLLDKRYSHIGFCIVDDVFCIE